MLVDDNFMLWYLPAQGCSCGWCYQQNQIEEKHDQDDPMVDEICLATRTAAACREDSQRNAYHGKEVSRKGHPPCRPSAT